MNRLYCVRDKVTGRFMCVFEADTDIDAVRRFCVEFGFDAFFDQYEVVCLGFFWSSGHLQPVELLDKPVRVLGNSHIIAHFKKSLYDSKKEDFREKK